MPRLRFALFPLVMIIAASLGIAVSALPDRQDRPPTLPGVRGRGVTLLPNGWRIAPAGRSIQVGDLPLSMVASADDRDVIVTNNGWSKPTLTVVDVAQRHVRLRVPTEHAWPGLAWHPDGTKLYSSGAAENTVNEFAYEQSGALKQAGQFVLGRPAIQPAQDRQDGRKRSRARPSRRGDFEERSTSKRRT